jgi:hypothetical protein
MPGIGAKLASGGTDSSRAVRDGRGAALLHASEGLEPQFGDVGRIDAVHQLEQRDLEGLAQER